MPSHVPLVRMVPELTVRGIGRVLDRLLFYARPPSVQIVPLVRQATADPQGPHDDSDNP